MESIPTVKVTVVKNEYGQAVLIVARCPFCGERHTHTCDGPLSVFGIREAHCSGNKKDVTGYELVA